MQIRKAARNVDNNNAPKRKAVNKEEMGWRCPRKGCRQEVALRKGTFFEGIFNSLKILKQVQYFSLLS